MVDVEASAVLLVILIAGLLAPELFKKFRLPYVTTLIVAGAILGPGGMGFISSDPVVEFLGFFGSAILLFMVGLETRSLKGGVFTARAALLAACTGLLPFVAGTLITRQFSQGWLPSIVMGIVFMSCSIALVRAILERKVFSTKIKSMILGSVIMQELASLLLLAIVLQTQAPTTIYALPIYFGLLIFSVIALKMFIPEITAFAKKVLPRRNEYEEELRFSLALLLCVIVYFSAMGVHPIIAAFIAGFLLADVITFDRLMIKLKTIGYGLFVPAFFLIIGAQMDLRIFYSFDMTDVALIAIVGGFVVVKFLSGYFGAWVVGLQKKERTWHGVLCTSQLMTGLAVVYAATSLEIIDATLAAAIIVLCVLTSIVVPLLFKFHKNG